MKSVLLVASVLFFFNANAQLWFDVGLKGGGGTGILNNKAISSDPRLSVTPGYNYFYGAKIGFNYGYFVSIATDFTLGKNSFAFLQDGLSTTNTFKYKIDYSTFNIAPLFRFTKDASYLEIGPEFSFINKATYSDEATSVVDADGSAEINTRVTNLVFGFGGYIIGNEIIALQMGLRFHYSLSNLTSDTFEATRFPITNYPDLNSGVSTNPFIVQLHLELNFSLGQIARSTTKCGRRVAFLSF